MNRTMLVAYREFLENVRTKGFWIGIFMMPVVLVMVVVIPVVVDSTRDAKRYAVIDKTGAALPAIQAMIDREDFSRFLHGYDRDNPDAIAPYLVTMMPEIQLLEDEEIDSIIDTVLNHADINPALSRRLQGFLANRSGDIRAWWLALTPGAKGELANAISTNRFILVQDILVEDREFEHSADIEKLNEKLKDKQIFAYFVIGQNLVDSAAGSSYVSNNLTDHELLNWFSTFASRYARGARLNEVQVNADTADWINEPIEFDPVKLGDDGSEEDVDSTDIAKQWAPVIFVFFLWISIQINTQMLITNTIEEKSNKLIEVLLSSVSPIVLMSGKIIGIAATGLTIIGSWILMTLTFLIGLPLLLGAPLNFDPSAVVADPWLLISFVVYYLLGYLLYAAMLVGLGSVCNNLKDAQNLMLPVQMIQMLPVLLMVPIGRDPNSLLAQVLSYIPPLTPYVMMNRAAGPPTTTEYVVTTVLLVISIAATFWLAAKVFRVGILMTGKPPGFLEILRLIRAPVTNLSPPAQESL